MDKKEKKRLEVLRKKHEQVRQRLAGARTQMDDKSEVEAIEKELAAINFEIESLKNS